MVENEIQVIERVRNEAVYQDLLEQGASVFLADILSRRLDTCVSLEDCLSPSISRIQNPKHMPDIEKAVTRICKAIIQQESIVFAVDHDMDGQGSAAVLWTAFVDYFKVPASRLSVITSHRLNEGYGITQAVVDRILATDASLIISADKGTSDEPRIKQLVDAGRDVVVTDHHQVPEEGPPISALACVNPARADSEYDPYVCGAGVAFLTMAMVRTALLKQEYLSDIPSLSGLMDYVAVATLADCVSIRPDKSYTNRAMVKRGIALINAQHRPCWQVFCQQIKDPVVTSQTIGFQLAPAVAAAGRLDWAETGFRFLTATTVEEAETHWAVLTRENTLRKNIEKTLRDKAFEAAASMDGMSILLYFEEGHSGVHGITASRLVEKFGKPSAMFAPKGAGAREGESTLEIGDIQLASGSFRGVPGFDTRAALQYISDHYPDILIAFGGHQGAAGATVAIENIKKLQAAFEESVKAQLAHKRLGPALWIETALPSSAFTLDRVDEMNDLDPWGRDFPMPVFRGDFYVEQVRAIGDGSHLKFVLDNLGVRIDGIWFGAKAQNAPLPVKQGDKVHFAFELGDNFFRSRRTLQIRILSIL